MINILRPFYYLMINVLTAFINLFIKRDASVILMGSWYGRRFGGNPRYLFQFLSENKSRYGFKKVVWVTREKEIYNELSDMGYEVYMMKSKESFYYHFKAGIHAINVNISTSAATGKVVNGDIMGELSLGAKRLHLNHGVAAIKSNKFGSYDTLNIKDKMIVKIYSFIHGMTFFRHFMLIPGGWDSNIHISQNKEMANRERHRGLRGKNEKFIVTGFPELCEPLRYTRRECEVIKIIENKDKVILFIPTYRTDDRICFKHPLDNDKFKGYLRERGYFWIDKLHPGAKKSMEAKEYNPDISMLLESEFDINIIVHHVDLIISDYSSAVQKAIYYGKPIVNYWIDIEDYKKYGNGIVKSFFEDVIGERVYELEKLPAAIDETFQPSYLEMNKDAYEERFLYFFGKEKCSYDKITMRLLHALGNKEFTT